MGDEDRQSSEEMLREARASMSEPGGEGPQATSESPTGGVDAAPGHDGPLPEEVGPADAVPQSPPESLVPVAREVLPSTLSEYRSPARWGRFLQVVFVAWVGLVGVAVALDLVMYRLVSRQLDNPVSVTAEQIDTSNDQRTLISVIIVAAMVVTGIGFMAWMRRLLLNLKPLGGWSRWTPGWAIGGWFVPILNLIRPKQVMDDIWRGSDPVDRDAGVQPKSAKVDPLLHWWWAFWLAGGIGGTAASYYIGGEIESRPEAMVVVALRVGLLVSAILAFWVVTRTTDRQAVRARAMTARPAVEMDTLPDGSGSRRRWWQAAALPVVGVAVVVVGVFVFDLPSPVTLVEGAAPGGAEGFSRYSNHGISFDYPAGLAVSEQGYMSEQANEMSGVAFAADVPESRVLIVMWAFGFGSEFTRDDLVGGLEEGFRALASDETMTVRNVSDIVDTSINGELFVHRTLDATMAGDSARWVFGTGTCSDHYTTVQVISADARPIGDIVADYLALIRSLDCSG